jgi:hypothetical protein
MRKKKDDCVMSAAITLRINDPFVGAGAIRTEAKVEEPEMEWRKQLIKDHTDKLFKDLWDKAKKSNDWDDVVGGF